MPILRGIGVTLSLALLLAATLVRASGPAATRIYHPSEMTLTKPNLDKIKRFILNRGQTCTYNNMFNRQPCVSTDHFTFYLHPDPGPNNQPQWNINCDPAIGDFNTLVVHRDRQATGQYQTIHFRDEKRVTLEGGRTQRHADPKMLRATIWELPAQAVEELLKVIEQGGQNTRAGK